MPESVSANAEWQYDYIDHYRLDPTIIGNFLSGIWGNYKYYVKARGCHGVPLNAGATDLACSSARMKSSDSGFREL